MYMCTIDNTYVHAKICSARPPPLRVLWIGVGTNAKTICRVCWARDSAKCRLSMFVRFLGWVLSLRRHSLVQFFRYFYFHSWVYGKKNYKFRMRHKKRMKILELRPPKLLILRWMQFRNVPLYRHCTDEYCFCHYHPRIWGRDLARHTCTENPTQFS